MNKAEWAMLMVLSGLWGGSFFFIGVAVRDLPPLTIVVLRVGLAALILNAALPLIGERLPLDRRVWLAFIGMGLLNNVLPFSLLVWGQTHIASGLASILNATTPLFGVVVAHLLTADERMTGNKLAGVLVGFLGTVVMVGPSALGGVGIDVVAQLACLAAALSYAFAGVFGRRFKAMGVAPIATAAGQVTVSAIMLMPVALLVDRPWALPMPGAATLGAILALAIMSTALAYILYFRILAGAGATNLLLVTFLLPVSALLLGALFLGESPAPRHLAGMALIGLGLAAIDGRLLRRRTRAPAEAVASAGATTSKAN